MNKIRLEDLYINRKMSTAQIAKELKCSISGINYWMSKFGIRKRSISEAIYSKHNPHGDPFIFVEPTNIKEAKLFGLGVGLYGEKVQKRIKIR